MKRQLLGIAIASLLLPAAAAVLAQAKPPAMKISGDMVKIGVLTDMSGVYSDLGGQGSVTAAQMAVDGYLAQNKPKFKIELVYADHQNKADVGSNKVREWFDTQGVDTVTDTLNSGVALAVAKGGKIREDGRMVHDMYLVEVKKPAESKEPWDYYHIKAVIPGNEAYQSLALSRCPLVTKK